MSLKDVCGGSSKAIWLRIFNNTMAEPRDYSGVLLTQPQNAGIIRDRAAGGILAHP